MLENSSANQTVRLVAGKILYIDARGQPIKLEETRTEPILKFAISKGFGPVKSFAVIHLPTNLFGRSGAYELCPTHLSVLNDPHDAVAITPSVEGERLPNHESGQETKANSGLTPAQHPCGSVSVVALLLVCHSVE